MQHTFRIHINPYSGNAEVLLDGQTLSPQSQLRICSTDHFFNWYKKLPSLLYAEVNDEYDLELVCVEMEYLILKALFLNVQECLVLDYIPLVPNYSFVQRIQWMKEAAIDLGQSLPEFPKFSIHHEHDTRICAERVRKHLNPFHQNACTEMDEAVNIHLTTESTYTKLFSKKLSENDLILVVDHGGSKPVVLFENCIVIKTLETDLVRLIEQWVDQMITAPYLMFGYEKLRQIKKAMSFVCEAKIKMLVREYPVLKSRMPDRLETGHTMPVAFDEFPESDLSLRISDSSVLKQQGMLIKGGNVGTATLEILSENGVSLLKQNIHVFFVKRVTSIVLASQNGPDVLQGDAVSISSVFQPAGAVNANSGTWSAAPAGILHDLGNGQFEAVAPGTCTITLTVGQVSGHTKIRVFALPTDIQMVSEVKAKLHKTTAPFRASLLPVGSACRNMDVRIVDSQIARWDSIKKEVVPVAEGTTELVVSAYDGHGQAIAQKKCKVTILPEKDVITPPVLPTLMVSCLVILLLTMETALFPFAIGIGMVLSIAETIHGFILSSQKQNNYDILVGVIGILVFGCMFGIYASM